MFTCRKVLTVITHFFCRQVIDVKRCVLPFLIGVSAVPNYVDYHETADLDQAELHSLKDHSNAPTSVAFLAKDLICHHHVVDVFRVGMPLDDDPIHEGIIQYHVVCVVKHPYIGRQASDLVAFLASQLPNVGRFPGTRFGLQPLPDLVHLPFYYRFLLNFHDLILTFLVWHLFYSQNCLVHHTFSDLIQFLFLNGSASVVTHHDIIGIFGPTSTCVMCQKSFHSLKYSMMNYFPS